MRDAVPGELITDARGRPESLVTFNGAGSLETHPLIAVAPSTTIRQALTRALRREPHRRFLPLVVTSPLGNPLGLVDVDAMAMSLMNETNLGSEPAFSFAR